MRNDTAKGTGDDFGNELEAYRWQFAFDKESIAKLNNSLRPATKFEELDVPWLLGLQNGPNGIHIYQPDTLSGVAFSPINIYSDIHAMQAVYRKDCYWFTRPDSLAYRLGNDANYLNFLGKYLNKGYAH